jgi:hypothetical protein
MVLAKPTPVPTLSTQFAPFLLSSLTTEQMTHFIRKSRSYPAKNNYGTIPYVNCLA